MPKVVGVVGFLGSGKDTAANFIIENFDYVKDSFAAPLKDSCAIIFGWDRALLEGNSKVSREWREKPDVFWANKFDDPEFTPRKALQYVGTDAMRNNLHEDIWVLSLMKRVKYSQKNVIVTDCRFPNEVDIIKNLGGSVIRVKRGDDPNWWRDGIIAMTGQAAYANIAKNKLKKIGIHPSEYSWVASKFDFIINNDGTLEELESKVTEVMKELHNDQSGESS